ncbi:MAG TPA: GNAT family N-acetyltransferase, partial [Gemmatimonadales bacterium]|nr:GNAT family N-acetyltransferase [Gemmatimonadales bacterium]
GGLTSGPRGIMRHGGWEAEGNESPQPTLSTERLLLRPFRLDDAPAVERLAGAREIADTTLTIPHPYLDGMAEQWIATHEEAWERRERVIFAMTSEAHGVIGAIGLELALAHRRAELGYWVGRPFWNRGYASEAVPAVIAFGFETLSLNRIWAQHLTRNPASGRVLLKAGMRFEGILREHVFKWDRPEDLAVYAILRAEYEGGGRRPLRE